MLRIISRLIHMSGIKGKKIKLSFVFSFIYSIFESLPTCAIFAMFHGLCRPEGLTSQLIIFCTSLLFIAVIGKAVTRYFVQVLQVGTGFSVFCDQRLDIGDVLRKVPMGYFSEKNIGQITSAVTTDSSFVENYSMFYMDKVITGFLNTVMTSIFILVFDWRIGILSLFVLLIGTVVYGKLQEVGKKVTPVRQQAQAGLVSAALEYIQGMAITKSFGFIGKSEQQMENALDESEQKNYSLEKAFSPLIDLFHLIFHLGICGTVLLTGYLFLGGEVTMAKALLLIVSAFIVFVPIEGIAGAIPMLRLMEASLDRIDDVKTAPLLNNNGNGKLSSSKLDIKFENVSFSYDQRKIINQVNFQVPYRSMTAIIGPSGSGKTTLCNLLARFWDVKEGRITIGDVDIRKVKYFNLMSMISMVFQNVYLFHDTVYNNISFGRPDATREEVIEASKKACCHDFIMSLEHGYDTMIREGGGNLSGGEKQRISIARAILKNAPIIILDEATASIDPENEQFIQKAISSLVKNKTVIMIAHRLQTIKNADQILVLNNGEIVQRGNHMELYQEDGIYQRFLKAREKVADWKI